MGVYLIENDGFRFQELDLDIDDFVERFPDDVSAIEIYDFSKNNMALSGYWELVKTGFSKIEGNENLMPDIANWIGAALVLSPTAYRLLSDLLKPFGEFLPVLINSDTYYIFNCLTVAKVLNPDVDADDFIFDAVDTQDKVVFKPPFQFNMSACCTSRLKDAIESLGLQGVVFTLMDQKK